MNQQHAELVKLVQNQVQDFYAQKKPFRVYHGSTNSTRVMSFVRGQMVDTRKFIAVLEVDETKRTALVQANVPMDKLVRETLKYGLIPQVVTEFPGITVAGAIQGAAVETSSHNWGCFSQTTNFVEMVLGNGELVRASPTEQSDLYYGAAGSYGSLGVIVAAEIKLMPAKKFVRLTHHPVSSLGEAISLTQKFAQDGVDYVECGMFRKDLGSVIVGELVDEAVGKMIRVSRPFDPWYYLYTQSVAEKRKIITNTMPLWDYLFRFNRGAFWCGRLAFEYFGVPFNRITRALYDPWMRTRKLYEALQESAVGQEYIVQDIMLPAGSVEPFMSYIDKNYQIYPTGFCAILPEPRSPLSPNGIEADLLLNIGVYGLQVTPYEKFVEANRAIEKKVRELGGKKWFYAHSYYSEADFWQIYDRRWYTALREKYHAGYLADIYARICVTKHYKRNKRHAAWKTLFGLAKLKIEDK